jgi:DNA-binding transcriptional regulator WhiA
MSNHSLAKKRLEKLRSLHPGIEVFQGSMLSGKYRIAVLGYANYELRVYSNNRKDAELIFKFLSESYLKYDVFLSIRKKDSRLNIKTYEDIKGYKLGKCKNRDKRSYFEFDDRPITSFYDQRGKVFL